MAEEPPVFSDPPLSPTTPLDNIVAGLLADAHHMQDMEYTLTEDEPNQENDITPPEFEAQMVPTSPNAFNGIDEKNEWEESEERDKYPWDNLTGSLENITERSTIPMDRASHKKRNRKRGGSLKVHRSVSPPNLPPPPPPECEDSPEKRSQKSPQKMVGFENFETELDHIAQELIQKPKARPPIPARTTSLPQDQVTSDVTEYMDEAFYQEDLGNISPEPAEDGTAREAPESLLEVLDVNQTKVDGGQDGNTSPGIPRKGGDTPKGHRRQVALEENATGRPDPSYEPRIDKESVPSSVAEAKKQLFGDHETETTRYRRLNTNNNNDSGESASPGTPKRSASVSDDLFQSIESALQNTSYMEKQSMDDKPPGVFSALLAGSPGAETPQAFSTQSPPQRNVSPPQQNASLEGRPMGLSRSSDRLNKPEQQATSLTQYYPNSKLKRNESQPHSMHPSGSGSRLPRGTRGQPSYNTLPTWSQMKASGMQVSVESNSQAQKTVYRSLV